MANDSLLRLRIDSAEYDSKISRAREGLLAMEKECRSMGGVMTNLEKEQLRYVESLGKMETKAQTTRGKIGELTAAYTDLRSQYNRLTAEEKAGDYGKALNKSLEEMRSRIQAAKGELTTINGEMNNNGSMLDKLSAKFGVNIKQLGIWGAAIGAGKLALDVMKDSVRVNESAVDEWGRIMESATSVYDGFLSALNNGNISGYLNNIDKIVSAARDAYDAIDALQTKSGVISNKESLINAQNAKDMAIINDKSRSEAERKAAQQRINGRKGELSKAKDETSALNNSAYRAKVMEVLAQNGIFGKEASSAYKKILASMYDTKKADGLYQQYATAKTTKRNVDAMGIYHGTVTTESKVNLGEIITDELRKELNGYIQGSNNAQASKYTDFRAMNKQSQKDIKTSSGATTKTEKELELVFKQKFMTRDELMKYLDKTADGSLIPDMSLSDLEKTMGFDLSRQDHEKNKSKYMTAMGDYVGMGGNVSDLNTDALWEKILNAEDIPEEAWEELEAKINEKLSDMEIDPIKIDVDSGALKTITKDADISTASFEDAASAIAQLGSAMQTIEDPAAKVMGIVAEAIATVTLSFAKALEKASSPWEWISAAATGIATMTSVISAIESATAEYHALGGVVGNTFQPRGTDTIPCMLSPGEVVLNSAQQSNIASQLNSNGIGTLHLETVISGEQLRVVMNNASRRRGRGEYLTSTSKG